MSRQRRQRPHHARRNARDITSLHQRHRPSYLHQGLPIHELVYTVYRPRVCVGAETPGQELEPPHAGLLVSKRSRSLKHTAQARAGFNHYFLSLLYT